MYKVCNWVMLGIDLGHGLGHPHPIIIVPWFESLFWSLPTSCKHATWEVFGDGSRSWILILWGEA